MINGGVTDLCSTISFVLLEKSLAGTCADLINSLCQGCAAARILEFKKEFSSSKSSNNTLCGSPAVSGLEVSVAGGGGSAKKASSRKDLSTQLPRSLHTKGSLMTQVPVTQTSWMFSRILSFLPLNRCMALHTVSAQGFHMKLWPTVLLSPTGCLSTSDSQPARQGMESSTTDCRQSIGWWINVTPQGWCFRSD